MSYSGIMKILYFLLAILIISIVRADAEEVDESVENANKYTHAEIVYPPGTYDKLSKVSNRFSATPK